MRWIVEAGRRACSTLAGARVVAGDDRDAVPPRQPARDLAVEVRARAAALRVGPVAVGEDQDVQRGIAADRSDARAAPATRLRSAPMPARRRIAALARRRCRSPLPAARARPGAARATTSTQDPFGGQASRRAPAPAAGRSRAGLERRPRSPSTPAPARTASPPRPPARRPRASSGTTLPRTGADPGLVALARAGAAARRRRPAPARGRRLSVTERARRQTEAAGARARRRPAARRRRARVGRDGRGQDDVRARRRARAGRDGPGDEPDVHDRPPLRRPRGRSPTSTSPARRPRRRRTRPCSPTTSTPRRSPSWSGRRSPRRELAAAPCACGSSTRAATPRRIEVERGDGRSAWTPRRPATVVGRPARRRRAASSAATTRGRANGPGHATQLLGAGRRGARAAGPRLAATSTASASASARARSPGLRIGVATARGARPGAGRRARGASRRCGALAVGAEAPSAVLAVIDARRGEAFAAPVRDGDEVLAPPRWRPRRWPSARARSAANPLAVGDGALRFRAELEPAGAGPAGRLPAPSRRAPAAVRGSARRPGRRARRGPAPDYVRAARRGDAPAASAPERTAVHPPTPSRSAASRTPTCRRSSPSSAARSPRRGRWPCSCSSCASRRRLPGRLDDRRRRSSATSSARATTRSGT